MKQHDTILDLLAGGFIIGILGTGLIILALHQMTGGL